MDEVETIDTMREVLHEIDELLSKVSQSKSLNLNINSTNPISKSDLDSFTSSFQNESNVEGLRAAIGTILRNHTKGDSKTIEIPMSLLELDIGQEIVELHLQPSDVIEDTLLSHNVVISIRNLDQTLCLETPHVDNGYLKQDDVVSNQDAGVVDVKDLLSFKANDQEKWEKVINNMEFQCLTQQIYQIISNLDLQLSIVEIDELAQQAICIALAWKEKVDSDKMSNEALHKFFGKNERGTFMFRKESQKESESKLSNLCCSFGIQRWGDHYGIGMNVEMDCRFEVLWKPKAQAVDDEDVAIDSAKINPAESITSITCCVRQGFPLKNTRSETDGLSFTNCISNEEDVIYERELSVLQDRQLSMATLVFGDSLYEGTQKSNHQITTKLEDTIKLLDDDLDNRENDLRTTEVFGWGDNACNCLGAGMTQTNALELVIKEPSIISFSPFSSFEPVHSIACSSCHTMLLTKLGTVYSCGDGSDGQLGHNSVESLSTFQLIDFFNNSNDNRIIVKEISVGSDDTSSHSAAIDSNYKLYTWGKSVICGHVGADSNPRSNIAVPKLVKALEDEQVLQVSCGGGFTLIRSQKKEDAGDRKSSIYSWGKTARGRLGVGKPKRSRSKSKSVESTQIPWCLCYPSELKTLEGQDIVDISAGSKHALAVNAHGQVYAWGSNTSGECSVVCMKGSSYTRSDSRRNRARILGVEIFDSPLSLWDDIWIPRRVPFFGNESSNIRVKQVSAGGIHSAAVDSNGLVYTWGGGGHGDCLGHGDINEYEYGITEKMDASRRQLQAMSGHLQVPVWAEPRQVEALKHCKARTVELGTKHGAIITDWGCMYSWGDQLCTPTDMSLVNTPSYPSKGHFQTLQGKSIQNLSCGSDRTFCITSGSSFGRNVGTYLLHQCDLFLRSITIEDGDIENESLIDCAIIAGGRRIYCHKIILVSRSNELKRMISDEVRQQKSFTEVFVPGVKFSVMKQIMDFLYTDTIDFTNLSSFQSVLYLFDGAILLKLDSLKEICLQILTQVYEYEHIDKGSEGDEKNIKNTISTLPTDLSDYILQQESKFADVKIITADDNSIIYAHKCILRCSSDYFKSLLDHDSQNRNDLDQPRDPGNTVSINIPGKRSEVFRLVYFLYTGVLAPSARSSENSHEPDECVVWKDIRSDLMYAEKFKIPSMKAQCENAISVTVRNSLEVLLLSNEVNSSKLKLDALNMICKILTCHYHVDYAKNTEGMNDFDFKAWKKQLVPTLSKCTGYAEDLFEKMKGLNMNAITPRDRREIAMKSLDITKEKKEKAQRRMIDDVTDSEIMSWEFVTKALILLLVLVGYIVLQSIIKFHPFLTIVVNVAFLVLIIIFFIQRL